VRHPLSSYIFDFLENFFILDKIREEIYVYKRIIKLMEGD
jgi:hypothetical protein